MTASLTPTQSAAAISSPKACDAGPAASHLPCGGAAYSVNSQSAAVIRTHPKAVGAAPAVMNTAAGAHLHPGLVSLPGSASVLDILAVALGGAVYPGGRALCGDRSARAVAAFFILPHPRDQIADDAADRLPVMPVSHAPQHDGPPAQGVAKSPQAQAREIIWALAPRDWTGKRKAAIAKVARVLGWEYARTWNIAHNRARRIDASEMDRLRAELSKLETQLAKNLGELNALDDLIRRAAGTSGAAGGTGSPLPADRERGDRAGAGGVRPAGPAGSGIRC